MRASHYEIIPDENEARQEKCKSASTRRGAASSEIEAGELINTNVNTASFSEGDQDIEMEVEASQDFNSDEEADSTDSEDENDSAESSQSQSDSDTDIEEKRDVSPHRARHRKRKSFEEKLETLSDAVLSLQNLIKGKGLKIEHKAKNRFHEMSSIRKTKNIDLAANRETDQGHQVKMKVRSVD